MDTDIVSWEDIEFKIQKIKYPLVFFIKLTKINHIIDDWQLSLIVRYYFKHNFELCMYHTLFKYIDKFENKQITQRIISDFYILIKKKVCIINILKKFRKAYTKNNFWSLDLGEQLSHIHHLKKLFLSNYEVYKSNVPFHIKIYCILKDNPKDYLAVEQLIERLRIIFKLFGYKFFKEYNILLINNVDFRFLSNDKKIKYASYFFHKVNKNINRIINSFELYNSVNTRLSNLLNPIPIKVETDIVSSETIYDDILFLIED